MHSGSISLLLPEGTAATASTIVWKNKPARLQPDLAILNSYLILLILTTVVPIWGSSLAPQMAASFSRFQRCVPRSNSSFRVQSIHTTMSLRAGQDTRGTCDAETTYRHRAYLAVGSNLGEKFRNIATALDLLCDPKFDPDSYHPSKLRRTSFLHHTAPMYVKEQPSFLNGAVEIETNLDPHALLIRAKSVEKELGRNFSETANGPRPVDLDLLFFDEMQKTEDHEESGTAIQVQTPDLTIPHPLMKEREFVLVPLQEVAGEDYFHPVLNESLKVIWERLQESLVENEEQRAVRILPLPRERMLLYNETLIMGILNLTPDSFSDGGKWTSSVNSAVEHALMMVREGANIIDIGGESTRPGAKEIAVAEQIRRTAPVIEAIRKVSDIPISIDTRHAAVAKAAIIAGADIVNDVSGGTFDPEMLGTVAKLGVPIILMHMRGTPESMLELTDYNDVVEDVASALLERSKAAEEAGIPRWLQVLDPGIGFAKDIEGNLSLLRNMARLRCRLDNLPLLLGTSRKGFIGKITGEKNADQRDFGTVGSCVAALCLGDQDAGCNILRVHNVKAAKDATLVMDAIRSAR